MSVRSIALWVRRGAAGAVAVASCGAGPLGGCGARSEVGTSPPGPPLDAGARITTCLGDRDCGEPDPCAPVHCIAGACVAAPIVSCDDGDDCTLDRCLTGSGLCAHDALARDEDGDGHPGPRPGFAPGAPGACGDDCDDTRALAFPGGVERCDGVDNDCNGVVDDGAAYVPTNAGPLWLSEGALQASPGGIASGEASFGVTFSSKDATWSNDFTAFSAAGGVTVPARPVTVQSTDSFTGPMVWTGSKFGIAWEDRRDKDFEIYFNRLDAQGEKLDRDLRVTNAPGFSLRPSLVWNGDEFVMVWDDRRDGDTEGRIYGQRVSADGALIGENVPLSPAGVDADGASLASAGTSLALVYTEPAASGRTLTFRSLAQDLAAVGPPVPLGGANVAASAVVWVGDRFVVAWDTMAATPGPTIRALAVGPDGALLVPERDLTAPAAYARSVAMLSLGDRLLVVWAEEIAGTYVLSSKQVDRDLLDLTRAVAVTDGVADAVGPVIALSPGGQVGVVYEDRRMGEPQVFAATLSCEGP